jgi:hypothetical protein
MYFIPAVGWWYQESGIRIDGYLEAMVTKAEEARGTSLARGSGDAYPYMALVARAVCFWW